MVDRVLALNYSLWMLNREKQDALSHAELLAKLDYDPYSGIFTWRSHPFVGQQAGNVFDGYRRIKVNYRSYVASRLAWFYMSKKWPRFLIDHKNGKTDDDRYINLRPATHSQNSFHKRAAKSKTGARGVRLHRHGRYRATICKQGKYVNLGIFDTVEEANQAYQFAAKQFFKEFVYAR